MSQRWKLHHTDGPGRFEASFPALTSPDPLPRYVTLMTDGRRGYFSTSLRRGASGDRLFLSHGALTDVPDGTEITFAEVQAWQFRLHRLRSDPGQRLALWGLLIAIVGYLIDGSLTIGKSWPVILLDAAWIVVILWVALVLKIVGLILVFWKGILAGDA